MTSPDRLRERLLDDQGRINTGVARVRCISLARAVVELLGALDQTIAALEVARAPMVLLGDFIGNEHDGRDASGIPAFDRCAIIGQSVDALDNARLVADRQRSRFDL